MGTVRPRRTRRIALILGLVAAFCATAIAPSGALAESHQRPYGEVIATCSSVTFVFKNFPNANNNTVTEKVFVHGVLQTELQFSFNGSTGSNTVPVTIPPGIGQIDGRAKWNTNGLVGGYDISTALNCSAPAFTIEKLQEVEGSGEGFTKEPLVAAVGKTIDYEVIVKNTGNTSLTFGSLGDLKCEDVTGGPSGALAPGESATYYCKHTLTEADESNEVYENTASITGSPPKGQGTPVKHTSNTVIVRFPSPHERPNGEVSATCSSITFTYRKFPNLPNNTVTEKVFVHGVLVVTKIFHFNGPNGTDTIPITVPPGHGMVDGRAKWNTNGFQGGWDIAIGIICPATPAFSIVKQQKIEGSGQPFTTAPLSGSVGQTVDYQVTVENTGNTSLTFSKFTDANCESVAGGPTHPLAPAESATWTCDHLLGPADGGSAYENSATVTGSPPAGEGSPSTTTSNTVVVNVAFHPEPDLEVEMLQSVGGAPFTTGAIAAEEGEVIDYEVVVRNTGNVPLYVSGEDALLACSLSATKVEAGATATVTCEHTVGEEDVTRGEVSNDIGVEGEPPLGDGSTVDRSSNTVIATVPPILQ